MPHLFWTSLRDQAEMFDAAGRRLRSDVLKPRQGAMNLNIPALVNGAFAAELALKGIIAKEHDFPSSKELLAFLRAKGERHDLQRLFNHLCAGSQLEIERHIRHNDPGFADHIIQSAGLADIFYDLMAAMAERPDTIQGWLKVCSQSFENWRYSFEHPHLRGELSFVFALSDAALAQLPREQ